MCLYLSSGLLGLCFGLSTLLHERLDDFLLLNQKRARDSVVTHLNEKSRERKRDAENSMSTR